MRVGGGHPSVTVHVVVVAAMVARIVGDVLVGVVGGNVPAKIGMRHAHTEAQVLRCVVHSCATDQPDALQVDGHVYLVACIGVPAEEPDFVVGGVYPLHPHLAH